MFPWSREREDVLQQVKKLRRPFTADDVLSIYRMTHFYDLPFEKLGFRSIHDFLASFPNFVVVNTSEGICYNVVKIDPPANDNSEGEEPLKFNCGDEVLSGKAGTVKRENSDDYVEILPATDAADAPSGDAAVVFNTSPGSVKSLVASAVNEPAYYSETMTVVPQPATLINSSASSSVPLPSNAPAFSDASLASMNSNELKKMSFKDILSVRFVAAIYENMPTNGNVSRKKLLQIGKTYPPFRNMFDDLGTNLVKRINRCSRIKIRQVSSDPFIVGSAYEKKIPIEIADYVRAVYEEDQRRLNMARARFLALIPDSGSIPHSVLMSKYHEKYGKALDGVECRTLTGCTLMTHFLDRLLDEENPKFLQIPQPNEPNYARSSKERYAAMERTKQAVLEFKPANNPKSKTQKSILNAATLEMWNDFEQTVHSAPIFRNELFPVGAPVPHPPVPAVPPLVPAPPTISKTASTLTKSLRLQQSSRVNPLKRTTAQPTASDDPAVSGKGLPLIYADEYKKLEKDMLDMATFPSAEILTFNEILLMKAAIHLIFILDTHDGTASFSSPITNDLRLHLATKIVIKKYGIDDFIKRTVGTPFEIETVCRRPLTLRNVNYGKTTQAITEFAEAILLEDDKRLDDAREQFLELLPPHPGFMSFSVLSSIYATHFHRELDVSERKLITGVEDEMTFLLRLQGDVPQQEKLVAFVRNNQWHLMISATSKTHFPRRVSIQLMEAKGKIFGLLDSNFPLSFEDLNARHVMKFQQPLDEKERRKCCGYGSIIVFCERLRMEQKGRQILYARRGQKFYVEKLTKPRECMPPSPKRKRVEDGGDKQQRAATTNSNPEEHMEVVAHEDEKFIFIGQRVTMVLREAHQRGEDTDSIILRTFNALYGK